MITMNSLDKLQADRLAYIDHPLTSFLSEIDDVEREHLLEQMTPDLLHSLDAKKACWLQLKTGDIVTEHFFYITQGKIMNIERSGCKQSMRIIDELDELHMMSNIVTDLIHWNKSFNHTVPALMLSKKLYDDVEQRMAELTMDQIVTVLSQTTDDPEAVISLSRCIKTSKSEGNFNFFAWNGNKWETQYVKFMVNEQINWLIRASTKSDEDWLIATPTSMEQFQGMLHSWFNFSVTN